MALKTDGTEVAWGYNGSGQTTVPAGLSGVSAIAAGESHTVALKTDGTVVAWGYNDYGQTTVPAGLSGVIAITAGGVSHGGAEDGRHGGGLGLQRLWPDDGASGLERGERHRSGCRSLGSAEDGRHGGGLGATTSLARRRCQRA